MGAFADYFASDSTAAPVADEAPGEFSKSLRAGAYGARSQLQSAVGLAGEALGFDEFAKNRRADAAELQTQVQANAPRIGSYKQVLDSPDFSTGLRNAGDYVTGLVGSSLPVMGAGIAGALVGGGGGALRGMLGATAATAPFEIGDIAQKQQADPVAAAQPVGTRAFNAGVGGLASAGVQSLVPGLVGQQILGKTAGIAAKQTLRQTVGKNLLDIPMEGATEAGGEATKQFATNQDKPFDVEALKESFVGGAAAGGAFAGVGTAADVVHGNAAAVGNATRSATSFVGDRASKLVDRTKSTAETVQTEAPKRFKTVSEDIGELFQRGKDMSSGIVDKVLNGEALVDAKQFATEAGQTFSDNEKVKAATEWTSKMANDAGLTPERRQQAVELAQTAGTEAGQVAAAAAKKTYDAGMTAAVKISNLYDSLADRVNKEVDLFRAGKAAQEEANGFKQSADFSGINKAIADQLAPLIDKNPGLADRPGDVVKLADAVRQTIEKLPSLRLSSDTMFRLIDMLGDQTMSTLSQAYRTIKSDDPAAAEVFFKKLNEINSLQQRTTQLKEFVGGSLNEAAAAQIKPEQYGELLNGLLKHARGEYDRPNAGPYETAARNEEFRSVLRQHFGDKADAVSLAIEKEAKLSKGVEADVKEGDFTEDGERITAEALDTKQFGYGKDNAPVMDSKVFRSTGQSGMDRAAQLLLDIKAKYPDHDVRFERMPGSDMGHVIAEKAQDPDKLSEADLQGMRLDTKKYSTSPDRLEIQTPDGKLILDTRRIASVMDKRLPYSQDGQPRAERLAEMFKEGAARLTEQYGAFDIPDAVVIGRVGGKDLTFGDVRKLDPRTGADKKNDSDTQELVRQREAYKSANDVERANLKQMADETTEQRNKARDAELARNPDDGRETQDESVREASKDSQIHEAAKDNKPSDLVNLSNMDGSARFTSDRPNPENMKPARTLMLRMSESGTAAGQKLGDRLKVLLDNAGIMAERDRITLSQLGTGLKPSEVAEIINPIARKYKDVIAKAADVKTVEPKTSPGRAKMQAAIEKAEKTDEGTPSPKSPAAKKAALLEAASSSDPALLKELSTTDDARGLQRTVMHLSKANFEHFKLGHGQNFLSLWGAGGYFSANEKTMGKYKHLMSLGSDQSVSKYATKLSLTADNLIDGTRTFAEQTPTIQKKLAPLFREPAVAKWLAANPNESVQWGYRKWLDARMNSFSADADVGKMSQDEIQTHLAAKGVMSLELAKELSDAGIKALHHNDGIGEAYVVFDEAVIGRMFKMNVGETIDAANTRMAELVQDPNVAYDLTKKYSMDGSRIHDESGNEGFGATHDSPTRHEGVFDWRAHSGKGEGNASFGAGTYLSTAEGVHKSYKRQFTAETVRKTVGEDAGHKKLMAVAADLEAQYLAALRSAPGKIEKINDAMRANKRDVENYVNSFDAKSPTYEVSVNIKPEQLLDWDKRLSMQSDLVKNALMEAGFEIDDGLSLPIEWKEKVDKRTDDTYYSGDDGRNSGFLVQKGGDGRFYLERLSDEGYEPEGTFNSLAEAKQYAEDNRVGNDVLGSDAYKSLENDHSSQAAASEYLQSLGILGHKYAASGGKNDTHPNYVVYDDSKITTNYVHFDKSQSGNSKTDTATTRTAIQDYITKVLGGSVKLQFKDLSHAGEFERMRLHDIIRLSTTALDPMSTAHHEALHGFFAQLRDAKATDIMGVLDKAASSENVIRQLNELYKNNGPVLAQLKDPEERVAYMYQHWAAGNLTIGFQPRSIMARVADFVRGVLGIWSNDQRALAILNHFNSGEYAQSGRDVGATQQKYIQGGRNQALDAARSFVAPLTRFADAVVSTGSGRLRDTGIPSIIRLADIIKREATDGKGGDQGFIAAARIEATKRNTALAEALKDFNQDELHEAMEGLQRGRGYNGTNATRIREAQTIIKATLADTRGYMLAAGVDIGNLGPDYFPRIWDSHYISKNQQAFKDMMEPYIRSGEHKGSADDLIRHLMAHEGSEFGVDRKKLDFDEVKSRPPGMQFKKSRLLSYITPEDAAMFVNKDLLGTLTTYIHQAARKAEWSRRLGNGKLELLFKAAEKEGATPEQLKMTDTYLRGIDGTLGDSINPHARRIMGNMIVYQNIRLLPFAFFSSVIDPMGVMVRGGSVKDAFATFKRGMSEIPKGLGRKSQDDQATQIAELVGVIDSAVLASTLGDVYTQGMVGGFAKKANSLFFKFNLMEGLNRSFRVGASEAAIKFIARHADGTDSKHSPRWIKELGLEAGDIVPTADGRIALTTSEGLSIGQERRVHAAINQWVDGAVLRPDAADKPIWMNDPRYALVSHLKQFVYSFQKTILERTVHEFKQGNYTPTMALASYVPMMMAADFVKGMIQGGGEQPEWKKGWDMVDYTTHAVQRAGVFGVGQFGLDMAKDVREGGIGVGALVGPTVEQFTDVVGLLGGHKQFGPMVLNAMPANALYKNAFNNEAPDSAGITK